MLTGLERLRTCDTTDWGRCGLLCNQASVTAELQPSWSVCREILGERLVCLFSPQHGLEATVQDNMIELPHTHHQPTGLPVFSLYHDSRIPTQEMITHLDTFIVDIQITGTRVYTFKYTISGILRAAADYSKKVVVLDRPNPLGGVVLEGRTLDQEVQSFVGEFPIPMRHGLTVGEAALFFNQDIKADLTIVELQHWYPQQLWSDLQRPWILTSPNMPTFDTVCVFPGCVAFEGTNVSEGRGTCLPFQLIGAPFILDSEKLTGRVRDLYPDMAGIYLRPTQFMPVSQKWQNQSCNGFQIHVLDPHKTSSYKTALAALRAYIEIGGDNFQWRQPPYEYEYEKLPIQLILGAKKADAMLTSCKFDICDCFWHWGLETYRRNIKVFLLYERHMQFV